MKIKLLERSACCFRNSRLSRCKISTIPATGEDCNKPKLAVKFAQAFLSFSSSTTNMAPLEAASKPKAPVPAKRSKQRKPVKSCPSQLNSVSRIRSVVGRKPGRSRTVSKRLRQLPPMIRIFFGGSVFSGFLDGLSLLGLFIFCSQHNNLHTIHRKIFLKRCFYLI